MLGNETEKSRWEGHDDKYNARREEARPRRKSILQVYRRLWTGRTVRQYRLDTSKKRREILFLQLRKLVQRKRKRWSTVLEFDMVGSQGLSREWGHLGTPKRLVAVKKGARRVWCGSPNEKLQSIPIWAQSKNYISNRWDSRGEPHR